MLLICQVQVVQCVLVDDIDLEQLVVHVHFDQTCRGVHRSEDISVLQDYIFLLREVDRDIRNIPDLVRRQSSKNTLFSQHLDLASLKAILAWVGTWSDSKLLPCKRYESLDATNE